MCHPLHRSIAVTSTLLISFIVVSAQRAPRSSSIQLQVSGQVRYTPSNRAAEFVLVRLESFSGGVVGEAITDRSGRFHFMGLSPDLYTVSARMSGYKEAQQQVDLRTQLTDYVQIQLVAEETYPRTSLPSKSPSVIDANVPQEARAEFEKASSLILQSNNINEGMVHLQNAIRLYPRYLEALLLLGTVYMDKKDWVNAETTLREVVTLDPRITGAHFALGELYLRQKKYKEAEQDLLTGIKLDNRSVQGHYLLGRLYYELGEWAKAGPHVGTALQLNPRFANGHLLAGNILLHARQAENALIEFEEYLRLEPNGEFANQARATASKIRRALGKS
jgi:Tfp pilus assembly protein PilF